ncbi:MAG: purine-nucleoside phosphorylase [Planctomycetia bacterium]|nr:purine-nucleoside phosphorylase [Planctomycetia bacterium]
MAPCSTIADRIAAAAGIIRGRWDCGAKVAVILGTGLGQLAESLAAATTIPYGDIAGFPCSTALAHKGRLVCGDLGNVPVIMMQGRCHCYEGYSIDELTLPIRVLAALGVKTLIVTNAAGGLNPAFVAGEIMLIDDHINLMGLRGTASLEPAAFGRVTRSSRAMYERDLAALAMATARRHEFALRRGVYVAVTGPSYETRAEYRAFRRIGGDCVGMSTVPEVLVAAASGLRVLGLSTVTNVACPDAPKKVTAEEVVEVAAIARPRMQQIVAATVAESS